ncbi:MAG: hypothetical protein JO326_09735 [Acetobacteraceae bacterium]|nr:hypothetical protein [Acetobacteraceae bacterium]
MNPPPADSALRDTLLRLGRDPAGRVALTARLSRMAPPAPRPYHRRIVHALLEGCARRHDGQVFGLANGDLVLLCRDAETDTAPSRVAPRLVRMLGVETPAAELLVNCSPLADVAEQLTAGATPGGAAAAVTEPTPDPLAAIAAVQRVLEREPLERLLQLQTGVEWLGAGRCGGPAMAGLRLRPLYREVGFAMHLLAAERDGTGGIAADPWLFRHLAADLDRRVLELMSREAAAGGVLDARRAVLSVHLNLGPAALLSAEFARLALRVAETGRRLGVEVALVEACADAATFRRAAAAARSVGATVVLEGIGHLALLASRPGAFPADLWKLDWSSRLADLPPEETLAVRHALDEIGADRVILQRADGEAAVRWGRGFGIRKFQGHHIDSMLAAGRMMTCRDAAGCSLGQCASRAAAGDAQGRAGCRNVPLLDAAIAEVST